MFECGVGDIKQLHSILVEMLSIGGECERSNNALLELWARTIETHVKHYGMCGHAINRLVGMTI